MNTISSVVEASDHHLQLRNTPGSDHGLSFTVQEGEIFGVLGANGSGKTTLLRMMVGLLHEDSGTLTIHGESPYSSTRGAGRLYAPAHGAVPGTLDQGEC